MTAEKLSAAGVETLAIVATDAARARLYFRFRQPRCAVGADPDLVTHRAYRVPHMAVTPEILETVHGLWAGLLAAQRVEAPAGGVYEAVNRLDGFTPAETDRAEMERHEAQFVGQFLVDREGIVRWANIEAARESVGGVGSFPADQELLDAARALPR
jgi:hypothetical protein